MSLWRFCASLGASSKRTTRSIAACSQPLSASVACSRQARGSAASAQQQLQALTPPPAGAAPASCAAARASKCTTNTAGAVCEAAAHPASSRCCTRVVLPDPRKPVTTTAGTAAGGAEARSASAFQPAVGGATRCSGFGAAAAATISSWASPCSGSWGWGQNAALLQLAANAASR